MIDHLFALNAERAHLEELLGQRAAKGKAGKKAKGKSKPGGNSPDHGTLVL